MKIGVLTDSTSYLNKEYVIAHNVKVASLKVVIDGQSFNEINEITNKDIFEAIDLGKKVTTSQPSPEDFLKLYEELKSEGYTDVIAVHISREISGTLQSSQIASDIIEGINVHVFDSQSGGMEMEFYVKKAVELSEKGLKPEEIMDVLTEMRKHAKIRITIDDLMTLVHSGRLSHIKGVIGNFIGLKPILALDENGKVDLIDKVRTKKRVISKIIDEIKDDLNDFGDILVHITHVNSLDLAQEIKNMIESISDNIEVIVCQEIGPVFAIHYGRGGFGVAWVPKH